MPSEFVSATMPTDGAHEGGLGLLWTVGKNPDLGPVRFIFSGGRKSQRIYVFPHWDMVVAMTATLAPEDDVKVVRPLVLALKGMIDGGAENSAEAGSQLEKLAAAGFGGSKGVADRGDNVVRTSGK